MSTLSGYTNQRELSRFTEKIAATDEAHTFLKKPAVSQIRIRPRAARAYNPFKSTTPETPPDQLLKCLPIPPTRP